MKTNHMFILAFLLAAMPLQAKVYNVNSPSGKLSLSVNPGRTTEWSLSVNGHQVMGPGRIALIEDGITLGDNARVQRAVKGSKSEHIVAPFYRQAEFDANYNFLTLKMKGGYSLEFRAYDDGVTYRFVTEGKGSRKVINEIAEFNFAKPYDMLVPYARTSKNDRYRTSFESLYDRVRPLGVSWHVPPLDGERIRGRVPALP